MISTSLRRRPKVISPSMEKMITQKCSPKKINVSSIFYLVSFLFPFRSGCLRPSASRDVITPLVKDGSEHKTIGRFTGLFSAFGSRQGKEKPMKAEVTGELLTIFAK